MKPAFSMRRGYRILYLHCDRCEKEQPFYRINSWPMPEKKEGKRVVNKLVSSQEDGSRPTLPPTDRMVYATCMVCNSSAKYVVAANVLKVSKYLMSMLCSCGMPLGHTCPHLEVLRAKAQS